MHRAITTAFLDSDTVPVKAVWSFVFWASYHGCAAPERGGDAPSTNGKRQPGPSGQPAANDPAPSTNGESDATATPAQTGQAQSQPSTNGPPALPGGNVQKKRLLTSGLHPKTR